MAIGMIRTNIERLVKISVIGEVCSPISRQSFTVTANGRPVMLPGVGGITYNVRVGDLAAGFECDHVEPAVSVENKEKDDRSPGGANAALNLLSCVGNQAVLVDFNPQIMEKLIIGDKIMIKAFGVGLKLTDFPDIVVMNLDPGLLETLKIEARGDKLEIPVTHTVPAAIMGSGLGASQTYTGDYDIQLFDDDTMHKYGLEDLRLGDIVAIEDADHTYGRIYKKGAMSVGIVVHSSCVLAGHGPGVTTLFTSTTGKILPKIHARANIADILNLRSS